MLHLVQCKVKVQTKDRLILTLMLEFERVIYISRWLGHDGVEILLFLNSLDIFVESKISIDS